MQTEYRHIRFVNYGDTGKTTRWAIFNNKTDSFLGEIKWYSAWRQYCFFTTMDAVFSCSCMRDILDFIGQLSAARDGTAKNVPTTGEGQN